jgi:hypothetical protein
MSATTLYIRDELLWKRARKLAGNQGLSSLVERSLREYLDRQEPAPGPGNRTIVLPLAAEEGDGEMAHSIEFEGRLLVDSEPLSLEQLPRIRVYRTVGGRLVVYRTWPPVLGFAPTYSVYPDLEGLEADARALTAMWITDDDPRGEHTDLAPQFMKQLRRAVAPRRVIPIDKIGPAQMAGATRPIALARDADVDRLHCTMHGRSIQTRDVLLAAMYLLSASPDNPRHLSEIKRAFTTIQPTSRRGNRPDTYKDLGAVIRGYLNDDTRSLSPDQRFFLNPKRGFWALRKRGETRAAEVLHQLGLSRA